MSLKYAVDGKVKIVNYPRIPKMNGQVGTIKERLNVGGEALENRYRVLLEVGVSFWFSESQLEPVNPETQSPG